MNNALFTIFAQIIVTLKCFFFFIFTGIVMVFYSSYFTLLDGSSSTVSMSANSKKFSMDSFDHPQVLKHLIIDCVFTFYKDDVISKNCMKYHNVFANSEAHKEQYIRRTTACKMKKWYSIL